MDPDEDFSPDCVECDKPTDQEKMWDEVARREKDLHAAEAWSRGDDDEAEDIIDNHNFFFTP